MTRYRLRVVLPIMVFLFYILAISVVILKQLRDSKRDAVMTLSNSLSIQMFQLQNNLSDYFTFNVDDLIQRNLADTYLDTKIKIFVLADENNIIRFSNHREKIGEDISHLEDYDKSIAERAKRAQRSELNLVDENQYHGYYPINLGLVSGELRRKHEGLMYFEYDFSPIIKNVESEAIKETAIFAIVGLIFAFLFSLLLIRIITHRVDIMNAAMNRFARGEFSTRLRFKGRDEITDLANGFDTMAENIEINSEHLQLMQFLIDNSSDAIFLITADGSIDFANDAAYKHLGYKQGELLTMKVTDFDITYKGSEWNDSWKNRKEKQNVTVKSIHQRKNGEEIPVEINASYFVFKGEEFNCAFARDISDRVLFEQKLKNQNHEYLALSEEYKTQNENLLIAQTKAIESDLLKSAFLANMSHEIRTPMNAILGFSQLLRKKNLSQKKRDKFIDMIDSGGERLLTIISDIIDISKIDAKQLTINYSACNLNDIIDDLYNQFLIQIDESKVNFISVKDIDNENCVISTDKTRLMQIISNLLENAMKFTEAGHIEFGYSRDGEKLLFYVKDTGIGIHPDEQLLIFDRFRQVSNDYSKSGSGTGLGLSIVKGLVALLDGDIWVKSDLDKGSSFYFTIPYEPAKKGIEEIIEKEAMNNFGVTILMAEDEDSNYLYMHELLSSRNVSCVHAKNGVEAIEIFNSNNSFDLVLMDIKMPWLNGLDATREIRKINNNIPIIALTAYAMAEDREKAISAGCTDYYTKPLTEETLNVILKKHISKL